MATFRTNNEEQLRTTIANKASATVIPAGSLVAIDTGLIIPAVAASTKVAFCPAGGVDGETTCEVTLGCDFTLVGTADANFAVSQKGTEVDITDAQLIDVGSSATDVLLVDISENAGTVGATTNVTVKINPTKVLF